MDKLRLFNGWLHRSYRQATGLSHFLKGRVSPMGWTLLGACLFTALFAGDVTRSRAYQFFCILLGLTLVSWFWVLWRRCRLSARRLAPHYATARENFSYEVVLENRSSRCQRAVGLLELAPDPRPDFESFHHGREPWEKERNAFDRRFKYYRWRWLLEGRQLFKEKPGAWVDLLQAGESRRVHCELTLERRGVVVLQNLRAILPDPLGAFQRLRKIPCEASKIIVLPQRYRLPEKVLEGSARNQIGGEAASNQRGQSAEYVSVRDYRAGDSLRHIHWKAWARTGKPVVLEYEETFFPRYGLILDTRGEFSQSRHFEVAVSIAASFASRIDTRESLIELMFMEGRAVHLTVGRGEARSEELLEALAAVEMRPRVDYSKLAALVSRYTGQLSSAFLPLAGWDQERAEFCERLVRNGVELTVFPVFTHAEEARESLAEHPCSAKLVPVRLGYEQEDLLK